MIIDQICMGDVVRVANAHLLEYVAMVTMNMRPTLVQISALASGYYSVWL